MTERTRARCPGPTGPPQPPPRGVLTPRIRRSKSTAVAGLHAAMPGQRDPPPEVAASAERSERDRKPPQWARPPPAAGRPRASRPGQCPSDTPLGTLPRPGACFPAPARRFDTLPPASFHQQVPTPQPRNTTQVPSVRTYLHPSATRALGGTSLPTP